MNGHLESGSVPARREENAVAICSFSFEFPVSAEELVRRVGDAVRRAGGNFSGDTAEGRYSIQTPVGPIAGGYIVSGQTIQIDVTDKPIILPCSLIRHKLNELVQQAQSRNSAQ
jgi:hypothetical protein